MLRGFAFTRDFDDLATEPVRVIFANVLSLGELKVSITGLVEIGVTIGAPPVEANCLTRSFLVVGIGSPLHTCFLSPFQEL